MSRVRAGQVREQSLGKASDAVIDGDSPPSGIPIRDLASRRTFVLAPSMPCVVVALVDRPDDARADMLRVQRFDEATGVATYLLARGRGYTDYLHTVGTTTLGELAPGTLAYVRSRVGGGSERWWLSRIGQAAT